MACAPPAAHTGSRGLCSNALQCCRHSAVTDWLPSCLLGEAAVYLDQGFEAAQAWMHRVLDSCNDWERLEAAAADWKGLLWCVGCARAGLTFCRSCAWLDSQKAGTPLICRSAASPSSPVLCDASLPPAAATLRCTASRSRGTKCGQARGSTRAACRCAVAASRPLCLPAPWMPGPLCRAPGGSACVHGPAAPRPPRSHSASSVPLHPHPLCSSHGGMWRPPLLTARSSAGAAASTSGARSRRRRARPSERSSPSWSCQGAAAREPRHAAAIAKRRAARVQLFFPQHCHPSDCFFRSLPLSLLPLVLSLSCALLLHSWPQSDELVHQAGQGRCGCWCRN